MTDEAAAGSVLPTSQAARTWVEFCQRMMDMGLRLHQKADASRTEAQSAELTECLMLSMSVGALLLARLDHDYPDWLPLMSSGNRANNPNPDNVYYITRIRGSGVYRVSGDRGTVRTVEFHAMNSFMGFSEKDWPTIGVYNLDDCTFDDDGHFEIIFSATRPEGHTGNWFPLDPEADDTFLMLRQISTDWQKEVDGRFAIQRIDQPVARQAPMDNAEIFQRLLQLPDFLEKTGNLLMWFLDDQEYETGPVNSLRTFTTFKNMGGRHSAAAWGGKVRIRDDEALLVEVTFPEQCSYWATQLIDGIYNALDFMHHQSGLNAHTGRVDPDGKLRLVVARQDTGAPNWLDKGNYEQNPMRVRILGSGPGEIVTRVIPVAEVAQHLYPGTQLVTPEERQVALRNRIEGAQFRRRW